MRVSRARVLAFPAAAGAVAAILLSAGCAQVQTADPGRVGCAVDSIGFDSVERLAAYTDVAVRGVVTSEAVVSPVPGAQEATSNRVFDVTVSRIVAARPGGRTIAPGDVLTVALDVMNPMYCSAPSTPTPGYQDYPLASEVPAQGTQIVAFLHRDASAPANDRWGVWGYASVDAGGATATFRATPGGLRGQTTSLETIASVASDTFATPRP